ncbi:PLP-dependent aminotransferase family protein [uncultured Marinobacter sp.]|uniref:aminotransferase-like domain-containing protein n=1 Tax=uncultured Marinobacter sp. TaxID=187379 RepID=UPI0030DB29E9
MAEKSFLYESVSEQLRHHIYQGSYHAGEKLPSVRELSRLFRVSVNTILQCFRQLEADGLIYRHPRTGVYVSHRLPGGSSAGSVVTPLFSMLPVEVSLSEEILRYMEPHVTQPMVRLGIAMPDPVIMPIERIMQTYRDITRSQAENVWQYIHPRGEERFIQQLTRRSLNYPVPMAEGDMLVTNGCMEAIELALRAVTRPGDTIAIETPTYYGSLLALEVMGRRALPIPTDATTGIDLNGLERALRQGRIAACLVSANAQNPLGSLMPAEAREKLAWLAARYNVPVIENDIWGDTVFGEPPPPVKAYDRDGMVIYCNSFSKTLMPGMRLGWISPGRFLHRVLELKQVSSITTASLPQLVMARLMETGFYYQHLRHLRALLEQQVSEIADLAKQYFPAGTRITSPAGGCVLWLELPDTIDCSRLYLEALANGIHVFPGQVFSPGPQHSNCLRLNAGSPASQDMEAAIRRLGVLCHQQLS